MKKKHARCLTAIAISVFQSFNDRCFMSPTNIYVESMKQQFHMMWVDHCKQPKSHIA